MLLAAMSATAVAQTSIDTALEVQEGWNEWTPDPGQSVVTAYWKYTAVENTLLTVNYDTGIYITAVALDGNGNQVSVSGAQESYVETHYAVLAGETIYLTASLYDGNKGSFTAKMTPDANLGKGLAETDPMPVDTAKTVFMGDPYAGYGTQTTYAVYTADKDGLLVMTSPTSVGSITVDGIIGLKFEPTFEIDRGSQSRCKMPVEKGKTYEITFTNYGPFVFTATTEDADAGSLYRPFTLVEGDNAVPAEAGDYYYIYTNDKTGYGVISGEGGLGTEVKVYNNKYSIESGQTYARSETGSYDVRFELPYTGTTYYVCVTRGMTASEPSTFDFAIEEYKEGEQESNPIVLTDLTQPVTTANAGGTTYYAVDVPAGDHKFLNVEATSAIANTATTVAVYMAGNSYSAVSGNTAVRAEVSGGTTGQRYIIRWTSQETSPITFTATLDDIRQGDLISDPIVAKLGTNTIDADGTRYYKYVPTKDCKLVLTAEAVETEVTFSLYTYGYQQPLTATKNGSAYSLSATAGTEYYIQIDNAVTGDEFTLAEEEFEQGETRDNPVVVEDGKFTFGTETYGDYWLQYTADKDGVLVIDSDVPYNYTERMLYGKATDSYLSDMVMSVFDGNESTQRYRAEVIASAGDVFLVNLKMAAPHTDNVVTFTIRDFEAGETAATAIELTEGESVTVPEVSRNTPMWYKATLPEGKVTFTADNFIGGYWYQGLESTSGAGESFSFVYDSYDNETYKTYYVYTKDITVAGEYYMMIDNCYGNTTMTFTTGGISGISGVETGSSVSLSGNSLNVKAADAAVKVYTVSGAQVVNERVSGNASFSLEPGVYIVKVNNTVKKIIVR